MSWTWGLKAICFGVHLQVQASKIESAFVGFKPFASQWEAPGFEFHPYYGSPCPGWGFWWDSVPASPACFHMGFLSFASCQFFVFFFPDEVILYVAGASAVLRRSWIQDPLKLPSQTRSLSMGMRRHSGTIVFKLFVLNKESI